MAVHFQDERRLGRRQHALMKVLRKLAAFKQLFKKHGLLGFQAWAHVAGPIIIKTHPATGVGRDYAAADIVEYLGIEPR